MAPEDRARVCWPEPGAVPGPVPLRLLPGRPAARAPATRAGAAPDAEPAAPARGPRRPASRGRALPRCSPRSASPPAPSASSASSPPDRASDREPPRSGDGRHLPRPDRTQWRAAPPLHRAPAPAHPRQGLRPSATSSTCSTTGLISLFYRAWEKYRLPIGYERAQLDDPDGEPDPVDPRALLPGRAGNRRPPRPPRGRRRGLPSLQRPLRPFPPLGAGPGVLARRLLRDADPRAPAPGPVARPGPRRPGPHALRDSPQGPEQPARGEPGRSASGSGTSRASSGSASAR